MQVAFETSVYNTHESCLKMHLSYRQICESDACNEEKIKINFHMSGF